MKLIHGDCLNEMSGIPDSSIDLVLTDLPYGVTRCSWDKVIDFEKMWLQVERIIRPKGAIVFCACQPFTTQLISSNIKMFRYCWIWKKNSPTGYLHARIRPMNDYEELVVFSKKQINYYPQGVIPIAKKCKRKRPPEIYANDNKEYMSTGKNYPRRVLEFKRDVKTVHPTQKPVALMEYLIKTYTNENETVLDFTAGSFTTGIACVNLNRSFIGIEKDKNYFDIGVKRIKKTIKCLNLRTEPTIIMGDLQS